MKKRTRRTRLVAASIAVAALFAGSAFTASVTLPENPRAGYGEVQVAGATVSTIAFVADADAFDALGSVKFTVTDLLAEDAEADVQFNTAGTIFPCTLAEQEFTCNVTEPVQLSTLTKTSVRVVSSASAS